MSIIGILLPFYVDKQEKKVHNYRQLSSYLLKLSDF